MTVAAACTEIARKVSCKAPDAHVLIATWHSRPLGGVHGTTLQPHEDLGAKMASFPSLDGKITLTYHVRAGLRQALVDHLLECCECHAFLRCHFGLRVLTGRTTSQPQPLTIPCHAYSSFIGSARCVPATASGREKIMTCVPRSVPFTRAAFLVIVRPIALADVEDRDRVQVLCASGRRLEVCVAQAALRPSRGCVRLLPWLGQRLVTLPTVPVHPLHCECQRTSRSGGRDVQALPGGHVL